MIAEDAGREFALRAGIRIEALTVLWMLIEAAVALGAGIAARSVLLIAFGFDSLIELLSGTTLLWRLSAEHRNLGSPTIERLERRATRVSAVLLVLLCIYVVAAAILGLVLNVRPEASATGLAVSAAAVIVMPLLAWRKRVINERLGSSSLRADIAESLTCACMAGTVLAGVLLNAAFGWWWAEYLAAIVFLVWLARETWEAMEAARVHEPE